MPLANKNTSSQPQNRHILIFLATTRMREHKTSAKGGTSRKNAYPHNIVFALPINYIHSGFNKYKFMGG